MPRRSVHAFTLIEAVVVLTIMGLLAAAVTVSLAGAGRAARMEDVADAYAAFDRTTREAARRFERTPTLHFDLNRGTVARRDAERPETKLALRGSFRVDRVMTAERDTRSGEAEVPVTARGHTPSYAVLLTGPSGQRWIVFAGLSGQFTVVEDERDVQDILSGAASPAVGGPDAR
jgi:prepilin-type N-terminal cleavage/methylation domain-containing protein